MRFLRGRFFGLLARSRLWFKYVHSCRHVVADSDDDIEYDAHDCRNDDILRDNFVQYCEHFKLSELFGTRNANILATAGAP